MIKKQMQIRIFHISSFISLKISHIFIIICLFFLFFYESFVSYTVSSFYGIISVFLLPLLFSFLVKPSPPQEDILPLLSKKYKYDTKKHQARSKSLPFEFLMLFFLQIGNLIVPYDTFLLQYSPIIILLASFVLRLLLVLFFHLYLRHQIMNLSI